ncbi:hypothetical protein AX16_005690 [Volvariella volvacea WC 439]|nr:hypothetical protein AX16_005690 [Volvariella volvacea WC 439]
MLQVEKDEDIYSLSEVCHSFRVIYLDMLFSEHGTLTPITKSSVPVIPTLRPKMINKLLPNNGWLITICGEQSIKVLRGLHLAALSSFDKEVVVYCVLSGPSPVALQREIVGLWVFLARLSFSSTGIIAAVVLDLGQAAGVISRNWMSNRKECNQTLWALLRVLEREAPRWDLLSVLGGDVFDRLAPLTESTRKRHSRWREKVLSTIGAYSSTATAAEHIDSQAILPHPTSSPASPGRLHTLIVRPRAQAGISLEYNHCFVKWVGPMFEQLSGSIRVIQLRSLDDSVLKVLARAHLPNLEVFYIDGCTVSADFLGEFLIRHQSVKELGIVLANARQEGSWQVLAPKLEALIAPVETMAFLLSSGGETALPRISLPNLRSVVAAIAFNGSLSAKLRGKLNNVMRSCSERLSSLDLTLRILPDTKNTNWLDKDAKTGLSDLFWFTQVRSVEIYFSDVTEFLELDSVDSKLVDWL